MSQIANTYAQALYDLAKEENLTDAVGQQLDALKDAFDAEPDFLRLMSAPNLSKEERCQILDDSFRGKVHPYLLNFLKILTEKGYMRYFSDCCDAYTGHFDQDNGILRVTAVTAVALSDGQADRLTQKLTGITGKKIVLKNRIDSTVLGGVRLDYDGQRLDDTVSHRMASIRDLLSKTVL